MHPTLAAGRALVPSLDVEADTRALGEQLRRCEQGISRWYALHCAADSLRSFTGGRMMSVIFVSALMIGLLSVYG